MTKRTKEKSENSNQGGIWNTCPGRELFKELSYQQAYKYEKSNALLYLSLKVMIMLMFKLFLKLLFKLLLMVFCCMILFTISVMVMILFFI
jgi:hypothetical protein